jgi:hypothetical protein
VAVRAEGKASGRPRRRRRWQASCTAVIAVRP